jgi:NADH-quinone oxidoreductase subunit N
MIYLGIELMSLPLYAMIALRDDKHGEVAAEAGLKYFFLGALASAMLLYGFSLLYGGTGSLTLFGVEKNLPLSPALIVLGFFFIVSGMAFKLSLVPFHMWVPDVYRGAPTFLTLFISSLPKIAAVILLLRLISETAALTPYWLLVLGVLSALSMLLGGVIAIAQTNIKRMLAYSTIGHMGYLMLGAMVSDTVGITAGLFYVLTYVAANLVAFGVILVSETEEQSLETLDDFRGLAKRAPVRAGLMTLAMLSLAGIPPMVGFFAKFSVIEVAWNNGFIWLAILAILTSVIAAFYYLRLIAVMAFSETRPGTVQRSQPLAACSGTMTLLTLNGVALIVLGILPQTLFSAISQAVFEVIQMI